MARVEREERVGHNQANFRDRNEQLEQTAEAFDDGLPALEFYCECGDNGCTEMVKLLHAEYEKVRSRAETFLVAPRHGIPGVDQLVERSDSHDLVIKLPPADRVARERDPRSDVH